MKVLIISEGDDTGGVAIAIKRAFDRAGWAGWEVRAIRASNNYIDYPNDIELPWQGVELDPWYEWADVIHAMERVDFATYQRAKPLVLHHHGTIYRERHEELGAWARARSVPQIASTIDLTRWDPAVEWLPNPVYVDWLRAFRSQYAPTGRQFVVGHTPTQRHMKGTDAFLDAMTTLLHRRRDMEMVLTEHRPWGASLADKARCSAYFDQTLFGYGLAGAECMAMGIPVIGGPALLAMGLGPVPLVLAHDAAGIRLAIERLADDPAFYREVAAAGEEYVAATHDERLVISRLTNIYKAAVETFEHASWAAAA